MHTKVYSQNIAEYRDKENMLTTSRWRNVIHQEIKKALTSHSKIRSLEAVDQCLQNYEEKLYPSWNFTSIYSLMKFEN